MARSQARVATQNGSRYLQQLCKHWSHKFPVDFNPEQGRINLGEGSICTLDASADLLTVRAEASDAAALPRLEEVIADHIKRFAFREDLGFEWQREPE